MNAKIYPNTENAKKEHDTACEQLEKTKKALMQQKAGVHIINDCNDYDGQMEGYKTFCGSYEKHVVYASSDWSGDTMPTCLDCLREMKRRNMRVISLYEQKETYKKLQFIDKKIGNRILSMSNGWMLKRDRMEANLLAMRAEFPPEGAEEYMPTP